MTTKTKTKQITKKKVKKNKKHALIKKKSFAIKLYALWSLGKSVLSQKAQKVANESQCKT